MRKASFLFIVTLFIIIGGVPISLFAQSITITPATATIDPSTPFSVTVNVSGATNVLGVAFDLIFNPSMLTFVGANEGAFLGGCATSLLTTESPIGTIIAGISRLGASCGGANGSGALMTLNFQTRTTTGNVALSFANNTICVLSGSDCSFTTGSWTGANVTISSGSGTPSGPDTTAPFVSITSPFSGTSVVGTVSISASASDNVGVSGVQFKIDGANIGNEDTSAPYSVSLNTLNSFDGSHTITAVARDSAGNTGASSGITVTVANSTPPPSGGPNPTPIPTPTPNPTPSPTPTLPLAPVNFGQGLLISDTSFGVRLSWTNPRVLRSFIVRKEASSPTSIEDGVVVFNALSDNATDNTVEKGKRYYYVLYLERDGVLEKWGEANVTATQILNTQKSTVPQTVPTTNVSLPNSQNGANTTSGQGSVTTVKLPPFRRTLIVGSKGTDVRILQDYLLSRGFIDKNAVTGTFGGITERGLRRFQCRENIICQGSRAQGYGVVSGKTLERLNTLHGFAPVVKKATTTTTDTLTKSTFKRNLSLGMTGNDVKRLQEILIKDKFLPKGSNTGTFGTATKSALVKFQEKYAKDILVPAGYKKGTGIAGPATFKVLDRVSKN